VSYRCLYCPFEGNKKEILRHFAKEHLCAKCGRFNPDWEEWRWCPKCREILAEFLAGGLRGQTITMSKREFMHATGRWRRGNR